MSWLQRLTETYDACFGQPQFEASPLAPIDHVEQQAHIEIVLDAAGFFLRAAVVNKESTLIPATEESAGRTSGPIAHPLCDKLRYVAADSSTHELYLNQLRRWAEAAKNPKLDAILAYVERGTVISDLVEAQVLVLDASGKLETAWNNGPSALAKLLTADAKTKQRDQRNALIRWRVELAGEYESAVWKDPRLQAEWASFNATLPSMRAFCFSSGDVQPLAANHPKRLRHGGDGAKLISANDSAGWTFRGRFEVASEAYGLSSAATQKAHNALRWLIARQSSRNGDQVVVAWAVQGADTVPVLVDTLDFLNEGNGEPAEPEDAGYAGDAGQRYARQLARAVRGYRARFDRHKDIVVMALDSATPGRMAILFYRELTGSEFLARLERWHREFAWPQNFGKERHFLGVPAPRDIAEAAYGRRVDEKLSKATVERLLPCIVDGRPLPQDLMRNAVARASNRIALERWEFERVLGIACSLVRGSYPKENYTMSLDATRHTRDYLYGRLLAIADNLEELALFIAKEGRETNAARLFQRFADHPYTTWRTLELQLKPYISRLRSSRPGALHLREQMFDEVISQFPTVNGENSFLDNRRLSGEFLLGFHSQREALRHRKSDPSKAEPEGESE